MTILNTAENKRPLNQEDNQAPQPTLPTHEKYSIARFFFHLLVLNWKHHMCPTILIQGVGVLSFIMNKISVILP